jgi:hypothetical protein
MMRWKATLAISAAVFASIALADDFKTVDGKEYKNVTVKRVEPDGLVLSGKSGISKVYFTELPAEIQKKYGYDPQTAATYSADQIAALEQARKQREEAGRQKAEQLAIEQAGTEQRQNIQALQVRYEQLQQSETDLLQRIGELHRLKYKNPARADLPLLESQLKDVQHEKNRVRKYLEHAQ